MKQATAYDAETHDDTAGRYAALLASTEGAVITRRLDGTILTWSAGAERMYGYSEAEAIGQPLSLIVPADRSGEALRDLQLIAGGGRVESRETVRMHRDRTRIDVLLTVSGFRDDTNTVIGALSVARDIGPSKRTENLLRASETELADATVFLGKAERLSQTSTWILYLGAEWSMTCSPESCRVLGLEPDAPVTVELFFSLVHPDDAERVEAAMALALSEHRSYEIEYRLVNPDGTTRWVHAWAEPEYDEDGEPFRVLGVVQDVTDRHAADETLRTSESRFRLLAENAHDLIFRLTLLPEPHFEYVSPAAFAITGYTTDEIYAQPALALNLVTREHMQRMTDLHGAGELAAPIDIEIRRKDGTTGWISQQLALIYDDAGALIAVEGIDRDITDRKHAEDEREYASLHDSLTGLPNRLLLRERLELGRESARAGDHSAFVVILDLDGFTQVNYTHGYATGDAALVAVADLLAAAAAAATGDMSVGRIGSDEFMFVGHDVDGTEPAALVERVRAALRQPIHCRDIDLHLQAHMGVAVDDPNESTRGLLHDAGIAVARAKQRRTDTGVEFFDSAMRTRANERFKLVDDLYVALEHREFELRYQPIVRLADNRIIGAEALIRWRHPSRGMIQPADFVPLAEDTGLVVPIGAWVLYEACAQLRRWSDADPALGELGMSVNLSVKQLRSADIVNTVAQALNRSSIAPSRLTVEMTESVFADDLAAIRGVLGELRKLGVRTAIDDFGTGYSSLAYLKHLPIDTLKIDKSFVDGLGADHRDDAIVASTLTVAKALTLFTVAEGVETAAQLAALRDMGCGAVQGFYVSQPVMGTDFSAVTLPPDLPK